jgi:hypothetical protein
LALAHPHSLHHPQVPQIWVQLPCPCYTSAGFIAATIIVVTATSTATTTAVAAVALFDSNLVFRLQSPGQAITIDFVSYHSAIEEVCYLSKFKPLILYAV